MSESNTAELGGHCPVAYFVAGEPRLGKSEFSSDRQGKTFHFVSAEAKQMFDENPQQYLPMFGGRCAFGMSIEKEFDPCPKHFKIIQGRLYLFLKNDETDALALWNKEEEAKCLFNANRHWQHLKVV